MKKIVVAESDTNSEIVRMKVNIVVLFAFNCMQSTRHNLSSLDFNLLHSHSQVETVGVAKGSSLALLLAS